MSKQRSNIQSHLNNKQLVQNQAKQRENDQSSERKQSAAIGKYNMKDAQSITQQIQELFDDELYFNLFNARCHDTGEQATPENARLFKDELLKRNVKNSNVLALQSLRLGINSIISLSNTIQSKKVDKLQLADNAITDYGMHAVKNILNSTKLSSVNLASNMISGEGLELFLDDLISNTTLKHIDLGVVESSMRKNSLGIQGAVCIAALLIRNKTIESLSINDNDFGPDGGECIGVALSQNDTLKVLKVSENELKDDGAIPIIDSAHNLETLSIAKNFLTHSVGKHIQKLLKKSKSIKKLQIEFNELQAQGTKSIAQGITKNSTLTSLNIKGNVIGDQGMILLAQSLAQAPNLKELDVSLNEIGPNGFKKLCEVLPATNIETLVCNKNFLGDDILQVFAMVIQGEAGTGATKLRKFDFSSCKLNDSGLFFLINALQNNKLISHIKLSDNFFSESVEALMLEKLNKNTTLIDIGLQGNRFSHSCLTKVKKIALRNVKMIEEQEPNKLKAEIYRLRYEHHKLEQARKMLKDQKSEIEKVKKLKNDLQDHMREYKAKQEQIREDMKNNIDKQKKEIKDKEDQIQEKNAQLKEIEDKYAQKLKELTDQYEREQKKKNELDENLNQQCDIVSGGIKMGVGGGWGWIGKIIGWHVDGLHGGDRSSLSGGNALLKHTKISGEGWLVSDSGWDTSKEGRHLRAGLGESENIINEEKHVLSLLVSEVLGKGNASESDTSSGARWLVHLSVDEGSL